MNFVTLYLKGMEVILGHAALFFRTNEHLISQKWLNMPIALYYSVILAYLLRYIENKEIYFLKLKVELFIRWLIKPDLFLNTKIKLIFCR